MIRIIGIYIITNLINNISYIGASNNIKRRWSEHKTPNANGKNKKLFKDIQKYKIENFSFEVIEICKVTELPEKEEYYIKKLNPYYNENKGGKGNKGYKVTDKTKNNLSLLGKKQWDNKTEDEKKNIIKNNLKGPKIGHEVSLETRKKLRLANLGKTQNKNTIEKRREKLKIKAIGNQNGNKKVAMINIQTLEIEKEFDSIKKAAEYVGARPEMITCVLKGRRNKTKGYYWKYL